MISLLEALLREGKYPKARSPTEHYHLWQVWRQGLTTESTVAVVIHDSQVTFEDKQLLANLNLDQLSRVSSNLQMVQEHSNSVWIAFFLVSWRYIKASEVLQISPVDVENHTSKRREFGQKYIEHSIRVWFYLILSFKTVALYLLTYSPFEASTKVRYSQTKILFLRLAVSPPSTKASWWENGRSLDASTDARSW